MTFRTARRMRLQWTIAAGSLYIEVAIVLLLVLSVASSKRWKSLFKPGFLQRQVGLYFDILLGILMLFLLDAIREIWKHFITDNNEYCPSPTLDPEVQASLRLFRIQSKIYVSGSALFLALVIKRLVTLVSTQADLLAQPEASTRQPQSSTTPANEAHDKEITELKKKIKDLEEELTTELNDKNVMKKQSENLAKEYDRLAEEHSKLQKTISLDGGGESKKDD